MPVEAFKQRFTPLQNHKLTSAGFQDLYRFITYLPYDLVTVAPLENTFSEPEHGKIYLFSGRLENITHRKGQQHFLVLDFSGKFSLRCYLFGVANYTLKTLILSQEYQLLVVFRGGFWTIEKFALKKPDSNSKYFILGQAAEKNYLLPKYLKSGELRNSDFQALHRRLQENDYILNLTGLVPANPILGQILNLAQIHRPINLENYQKSLQQWISFKVFLRLSLLKYIDSVNQTSLAPTGNLDMEFLQRLIAKLPFQLSPSQKQVVWDILQDITIYTQ